MTSSKWYLTVCGINHKISSTSQREPLQIGRDRLAEANSAFGNLPGVRESVIVSTCNRVEFYFVSDSDKTPLETVRLFYREFRGYDISDLGNRFYVKKGSHTASHLFMVSTGMDSMVLGENEILGQAKDAYSSACSVRVVGKVLHRLFHQAFRVGKQVRTDTGIGSGACSVSSAAVALLKKRIGDLEKPAVLFIGVNQMTALAASNLSRIEEASFSFANRTEEKAVALADRYNAEGYSLTRLPDLLPSADIVVSCTGSELPVITSKMMDDVIAGNAGRFNDNGRALTIVDLAIPRDVEFDGSRYAAVDVLNMDDINEYVKSEEIKKQAEIPKVQEIIDRRLGEFVYWFDHVRHEPIYNGLDDSFEKIRKQEISLILKKLPSDLREEVDKSTKRMVNRLLQIKVRTSGKE